MSKRRKGDHVVMNPDPKGEPMLCTHCGATRALTLPAKFGDAILQMKAFVAGHKHCPAPVESQEAPLANEELLSMRIRDTGFPVRARNAIEVRLRCETLGDLVKLAPEDLTAQWQFGRSSLLHVRRELHRLGLRLRGDTWTPT